MESSIDVLVLSLLCTVIERKLSKERYKKYTLLEEFCIWYIIILGVKWAILFVYYTRVLYNEERDLATRASGDYDTCNKLTEAQYNLTRDLCEYAKYIVTTEIDVRVYVKMMARLDLVFSKMDITEYIGTLAIISMNIIIALSHMYMTLLNCCYRQRNDHVKDYVTFRYGSNK